MMKKSSIKEEIIVDISLVVLIILFVIVGVKTIFFSNI